MSECTNVHAPKNFTFSWGGGSSQRPYEVFLPGNSSIFESGGFPISHLCFSSEMTLFHRILIRVKLSVMHWWHVQLSLDLCLGTPALPVAKSNHQPPVHWRTRFLCYLAQILGGETQQRSKRQYREHAGKCPTPKPWAPCPFINAICPFYSWVMGMNHKRLRTVSYWSLNN